MKKLWFALVLTTLTCGCWADEFRGVWVDAWGAGLLSQAQIKKLLGTPGEPNSKGDIRDANLNALVVQVRRRADVCYPSAMGEPYFTGLNPSNFNALQAIIDAAHDTTGGKQRIEVHAWLVAFATGSSASASPVYYAHNDPSDPEYYWVTLTDSGSVTDDKALDPGHPKCLEYLVNVCMDLVENFDIDGINYDYVRFTAADQGFNPTSVARYNAHYGLTGKPSSSSEQFKQWRRDQITAFIRQAYARIQAVKPQVKQSASVATWNPSPTSSTRAAFRATRPYYDVYSDWDAWMQEGILDMAIPMTYYNYAALPEDYGNWMNFQKDRKFNRHMIIGPGIYLNSLENAIGQILMTRNPSSTGSYCQGFCGYSYRLPYVSGTWANFQTELSSKVTQTPAEIPPMPWKTSPTRGHISGTVTFLPENDWADGAVVNLAGPQNRTMLCDGTGFYAFIDLVPGIYTVAASKPGLGNAQATVIVQIGEVTGNMYVTDLLLGATEPIITDVQVSDVNAVSARITWNTNTPTDGMVQYGTSSSYDFEQVEQGTGTSHSVTLTGLIPHTTYHFRCISSNNSGSAESGDRAFTTADIPAEIVVDNTDPGWTNTSPGGNTWSTGSLAGVPRIGTNYLYYKGDGSLTQSSVTRRCRWTPDLPIAGLYDVYVFYQMGSNRNTAAPYTIHYNGGQLHSVQNQYSTVYGQETWCLIGSDLPFSADTNGYVELTTLSPDTGLVSADAAKWVLKQDSTPPVIDSVSVEPAIVAGGDAVNVTVGVTDNRAVIAVTANGVALTKLSESLWIGTLDACTALGAHTVTVEASDAADNTAADSSSSYVTARVVGISGRSLEQAGNWIPLELLVKAWGRVTRIDSDRFTLTDGDSPAVAVYCPTHGLSTGDFAWARGILRPADGHAALECLPEHVSKIQ